MKYCIPEINAVATCSSYKGLTLIEQDVGKEDTLKASSVCDKKSESKSLFQSR